jgi:glycosyltransferase involved in cell wall biosynthesis
MISGRDIIFISSIEWNYLWQIHQEIALRLAEAGNRVLYIENTGVRSPGLKDFGRAARRLEHWGKALASHGVRQVRPNIFVASPLVMPPFGGPWRRAINRRFLLPTIKRIAVNLGMQSPLLWTYLPTDSAVDLIRLLSTPRSVVVYYCGADFSHLTPHAEQCRRSEEETLKLSDLVLATCRPLAEHCEKLNDNVHIMPAIVNLDRFPPGENNHADAATHGPGATPPRSANGNFFTSLKHPVMGYVGGLHRYVDYSLLTEVARARPHWSWVFVGAVTAEVGELAKLPNVHLLGQMPHGDLAHYIRRFDVCLVPYVNNRATATVVPLKLNEYLALGKPVVSTQLPTVCDFNQRHQVLITAPSRPESFLDALERALGLPNDAETVARRRAVAALGDSKSWLNAVSRLIEMKDREKTFKWA